MDIVSHGLWGSAAFGRKNKKSFWTAFFFGIMPDLLAFGPFFIGMLLGIYQRPDFNSSEPPVSSLIPSYVSQIYSLTHSLVVFAAALLVIWVIFKKIRPEIFAWGLHILVDIPTHSYQFFPTPFLWPISHFEVNGVSWGHPYIFFPNIALLVLIYVWFFIVKKRGGPRI